MSASQAPRGSVSWDLMLHIKCNGYNCKGSRDSSLGIATGYGLDNWGVEFSLLHNVQTGSGAHSAYPMGTGVSFRGSKAAGAWSWPLTSNQCRDQENVDLYIYCPTRLHGVVLHYLSTGTTLQLQTRFLLYLNTENISLPFYLHILCSLFTSFNISLNTDEKAYAVA
jgi:hypothetical protein